MKQFFGLEISSMTNGIRSFEFCPYCGVRLTLAGEGISARRRCDKCGFTPYYNPSPGVVVLIEKDGKVLLGRRSGASFQANSWCLPGGFMEFGENFLNTAHREVAEETSLEVEIRGILNVVSNFLSERLHTLVIVLLASPHSGNEMPGDDVVELGWFPLGGPLPPMAFEADEYIIQQFAAGACSPLPVDPRYRLGPSERIIPHP